MSQTDHADPPPLAATTIHLPPVLTPPQNAQQIGQLGEGIAVAVLAALPHASCDDLLSEALHDFHEARTPLDLNLALDALYDWADQKGVSISPDWVQWKDVASSGETAQV